VLTATIFEKRILGFLFTGIFLDPGIESFDFLEVGE